MVHSSAYSINFSQETYREEFLLKETLPNKPNTGKKHIMIWILEDQCLRDLKTGKEKAKSAGPVIRKEEGLINEAENF